MIAQAQQLGAQAQQLGAQAQQMAAAQQAAARQAAAQAQARTAATVTAPVAGDDLASIGRRLAPSACRGLEGLAAYGYDQSKAVDIVASKGVTSDSWDRRWPAGTSASSATRRSRSSFNKLYTGR